jgi:hypothetical protein
VKLRTRWANWKLKRERRKLGKESDSVAKEAKQKKNDQILDEWYSIHGFEFDIIDAQIKENISRDVLDQAEGLYLPTPNVGDRGKWIPDDDLGNTGQHWSVLTPEALTELNGAIRQERKARRETLESWAKIIGAIVASLTGVIGALIGLIAILNKWD